MNYLSVTAYAKLVKRDPSRIRHLCAEGRIPGAEKIQTGSKYLDSQGVWIIPSDAKIIPPKATIELVKRHLQELD